MIRRLAAAAAALALVGVAPWAWTRAASRPHIVAEGGVGARDVALVLGARVGEDGVPSTFLTARLEVARRLFAAGRVRALLVSGDGSADHLDEPAAMRRWLVAHGVPADRVVTDPAGFDTYDSCVRARRVYGVHRVVVVTQAYHLPRAVATCRAVGVDAVGVGDETVRASRPQTWVYGELREVAASWKMVVDLVSRREPAGG